jgi:hypothetical protein
MAVYTAKGATRFALVIPEAGHVTLEAFDISGRRVANLVDAGMSAGVHEAVWNTTTSGARIAPGLYLARLSLGRAVQTRRVVVLE